jgi:hypothetical protein
LWAQDITPEKVGQVMADNGERLALLSDEAGIFDIMGGRYSAGVANLDIFLQAHSGFFYRVDRGSRLPITMKHPALAIGLSPQPSVLRVLGENKAFRGRGLLARFLYALPMSTVGNRTFLGRPVAPHISAQYSDHIQTLLGVKPPQTEHNELGAYTLYLDDDAAAELHALSLQVEAWMKEGGHYEHVKDWAGKLPGAAARLAGVLHCATHAYGQPWTVKISLETMREVVGLAVVLGQHALAAFDLMGADIALEGARKVLRWIERKQKPLFSGRDCFQDLRGSFKTMNDLTTAIDILVERFYLFRQQAPSNGGRPPSPTFTVNPTVTKRWL